MNGGAFFLLPLGVPFFLLGKRERMVRRKDQRDGEQTAPVLPEGPGGMLTPP